MINYMPNFFFSVTIPDFSFISTRKREISVIAFPFPFSFCWGGGERGGGGLLGNGMAREDNMINGLK